MPWSREESGDRSAGLQGDGPPIPAQERQGRSQLCTHLPWGSGIPSLSLGTGRT